VAKKSGHNHHDHRGSLNREAKNEHHHHHNALQFHGHHLQHHHTPVHHDNHHFFVGPTSSPLAAPSSGRERELPDGIPSMTTSSSAPSSLQPGSPIPVAAASSTAAGGGHSSVFGWEATDALAVPTTNTTNAITLRRSPTPLGTLPNGSPRDSSPLRYAHGATAVTHSSHHPTSGHIVPATAPVIASIHHSSSHADLHHHYHQSSTPMTSFAGLAPAPLTISTSHRGSRDDGSTSTASTPVHNTLHVPPHSMTARDHHATYPAPLALISPTAAEHLSSSVPGSPATFAHHHTSLPSSAANTPHASSGGTPPMHTPATILHHQSSSQPNHGSLYTVHATPTSTPHGQQQTVEDIVDEAFRTCALTHDGELSFQEFVKFTQQTPSVIEALERVFVLNYWNDIKHPTKAEVAAHAHHHHGVHHPATHAHGASGSTSPHPLSISTSNHHLHHHLDRPGTPVAPQSPTIAHSQSVPQLGRPASGTGLSTLVGSTSRPSGLGLKKKSVDHGEHKMMGLTSDHMMMTPTPSGHHGGIPMTPGGHDEDSGPRLPAMQCGSCGWRLRFCHQCGGELPLTATLAGLSCDQCGKLWKDWGFCMQCGGKLPQLTGVPEEPVPPTPYDFPNNPVGHMTHNPEDAYKEGPLFKKGARLKQWQERWFVFRSNFLYMFRSASALQPHKVWFLEGCFIEVIMVFITIANIQSLVDELITKYNRYHQKPMRNMGIIHLK
jgi:hypothetical protein